MRMKTITLLTILTMSTAGLLGAAEHRNDVVKRVDASANVLNTIMNMKTADEGIPQNLLDRAQCVAIIPGLKKGAFIVGASYGKGTMACRTPDGNGWTPPSMISMEGGSFGFQIGGNETDIVMLVMNQDGANKLMNDKFTLGGGATVAAGPVGRSAQADTDAYMHAEILAYSRSRGVFAGISLKGSTLRPDKDANQVLYGRPVSQREILQGKVTEPEAGEVLTAALNRYSAHEHD